ncbi:unnamed protein product [Linum trigynum]|uniref:Uncharacterized protein n=1 Tax=Linum trigynum TaxID=586398 RepID=A0AAV2FXQ9_9ROSI
MIGIGIWITTNLLLWLGEWLKLLILFLLLFSLSCACGSLSFSAVLLLLFLFFIVVVCVLLQGRSGGEEEAVSREKVPREVLCLCRFVVKRKKRSGSVCAKRKGVSGMIKR